MRSLWHRWPVTVMFVILTLGFTFVAVRQQKNFDEHCYLLQSRWDVVNAIIVHETDELGAGPRNVTVKDLRTLNGERPTC